MLQQFRNAAKSWVSKLLMGLLVLSFAIWGIRDIFGGWNRTALATVGSQEISGAQFTRAFNDAIQNIAKQSGQAFTADEARKLGIDRQVLDNLIQQAALDEQATKLKLAVGEDVIAAEVQANPAFKGVDGKFDVNLFRRILEQNGLSEADFFAREKELRLRDVLNATVADNFPVPSTLTEALFRYRNEQRDAKYFSFPVSEADVPAPTADDLKKQYESTPAAYTAPEYRSLTVMKVDPADVAPKVNLTEEEIAAGYEQFKGDYYTPELRTLIQLTFPDEAAALKAKERIGAGEDILKIATEMGAVESDVTLADKSKTDIFDPAVADAAFALAEGAVSEPIKGGLATVLVKVVKITPEKQKTLEEVRTELTSRLQLERAHDEIQSVFDAVEDARAQESKFEEIASRAGISITLVPAVSAIGQDREGKDVILPYAAEVLKASFASDVGVENDPLTINDGFVWYEVREVIPSALRPLEDVKDKVTADFKATRLRVLAGEKAQALVERARGGATLDALAAELSTPVKAAQGLKRNEVTAEFDGQAVAALFGTAENGFAWALEGDGKSARVMQSSAVLMQPFAPESDAAKALAASIANEAGNDLNGSYLLALRDEIGVSVNETLWRQITGTAETP
jgi:peptidyl-prolyl cis-trans isomerase D